MAICTPFYGLFNVIIQGVLRGLLPQNSCPVFLLFLRGITFRPQSEMNLKKIIKKYHVKNFVKLQ